MRAPLAVRLSDGMTDQHVTKHLSRLRFRKTAPGGHADASCQLDASSRSFPDLGPTDRLWIYDTRTGSTTWEGYVNNPGTRSGQDGQGYDITALGGQSRMADHADRYGYIDRDLGNWRPSSYNVQKPNATRQSGNVPGAGWYGGEPALQLQFVPGTPVGASEETSLMYTGFLGGSMTLGGYIGCYDAGAVDPNYAVSWFGAFWNPGDPKHTVSLGTGMGAVAVLTGNPSLLAGRGSLVFQLYRATSAGNVGQDNVWAVFGRIAVLGHLMDRYGALKNMPSAAHLIAGTSPGVPGVSPGGGSYYTAYVLAHEVVEDLLGRSLTFCDPATAQIDGTTFKIDQLAYPDSVKPARLLDDLTSFEPDMIWEVLETTHNSTGRHRFNYRGWPTTPRYMIPPSIPTEQLGSDLDLCNRIVVKWTDERGIEQSTVITSTVPALDAVGRIRDADPVTLRAGLGSLANAERVGGRILEAKASPPRAARVVVDQPIMDLQTGCLVHPWEIEPGYLARVVATGDDLRVTEMEYDDDSCAAHLQLGTPALTTEQWIAQAVGAV
ncbi:hypothetical protein [Nocardioides soli]|uniref:Uncharacterized protein n=1 Tax=Nocardioides soli TaxID=1036020 RepID=A0A7W4VT16_9ACTN|nr:hypothetical protein [Nocardioides soli]MBB3041228.1 hypothetical protein [Nocardioides soli]